MDRRSFLMASSASAAAWTLPGLSWAAQAKTFRWVPQADLTLLDPLTRQEIADLFAYLESEPTPTR